MPLAEISEATKISTRYLEAMEQDRFDVLPASVFARGFLREYAKFVGLDPDEVVNSYLTALQEADDPGRLEEAGSSAPSVSRPERKNNWFLIVALVIGLLLVAFLIYWGTTQDRGDLKVPTIAAPVLPPAPARPTPPPTEQSAPLVVTMDFTQDCWVELTVDGRRRISELHVQGESKRLEAQDEIRLTLGNAEGVRIEVNGEPYPLFETAGQTVRDLVINVEDFPSADVSEE